MISQRPEDRRQRTEGRGQKAEDRGQRTEDRPLKQTVISKWFKIFGFMFACFCQGLCYAGEYPKYEIKAVLDTSGHTIKARQKVTLTNNSDKDTNQAYFHIYPNRKYTEKEKKFVLRYAAYFKVNPFPEGFQGGAVRVNSVNARGDSQPLEYAIEGQDNTILKVTLPNTLKPKDEVVIDLDFFVHIPHAMGRFGWHKNITSLLRWYPMLAVLDSEGWHNYPFYPYHQPYFSDASLYSLELTLPEKEVVAHSGVLEKEIVNSDGTKTLFIESELPLRDFGLAVSKDYRLKSEAFNGVTINSYYLEGDEFYAGMALSSVKALFKYYTGEFSPYPYKEFSIAPSYLAYGGTQSSNIILIDTRAYKLPKFLVRYFDFLVSHEAGHQWFYNLVGSDEYKEMFIDEGFNSYFILRYLEDKYGPDAKVLVIPQYLSWLIPNFSFSRAQSDRYSFVAKYGLDRPVLGKLSSFKEPSSIFSIAYGKGSKVVDMLSYVIGDEHFAKLMQRYFREFQFQNISVSDIKLLAEQVSKANLDWFFQSWLEAGKQCDYALKYVSGNKLCVENLKSIQMPVDIEVKLEDNKVIYLKWDGKDREKEFILDTDKRISSVEIDPQKRVLDADRVNNNWRRPLYFRPVALYYPAYEIPVFLKEDGYSLITGPQLGGSDIGIKSSLQSPQDYILFSSNTYNFNEDRVKNTVGFQKNHLFGRMLKSGVEVFDYNDIHGSSDQRGFKLFLRQELWPVGYGFMDENDHITLYLLRDRDSKAALATGGFEDIKNLHYRREEEMIAGVNLKVGKYGPYPDPVSGWKFNMVIEQAGHFLGGQNYFWRLAPQVINYYSLAKDKTLALKLKSGFGYPDDKVLFQLGGEGGLRGYGYKTIGGSRSIMLNLEYRQDIIDGMDLSFLGNILTCQKIQGVVFFDAGKSWFDSFKESDFSKDAGLGLRLHFNIGSFLEKLILRFDTAWPLNHPKAKEHSWVGLSHAF